MHPQVLLHASMLIACDRIDGESRQIMSVQSIPVGIRRLPNPPPGIFVVERNSIAHVILMTSIHPLTEQIALRTDINRVPWLILRFPEIVIIVMNSLNHQEAGTRFLMPSLPIATFRAFPLYIIVFLVPSRSSMSSFLSFTIFL